MYMSILALFKPVRACRPGENENLSLGPLQAKRCGPIFLFMANSILSSAVMSNSASVDAFSNAKSVVFINEFYEGRGNGLQVSTVTCYSGTWKLAYFMPLACRSYSYSVSTGQNDSSMSINPYYNYFPIVPNIRLNGWPMFYTDNENTFKFSYQGVFTLITSSSNIQYTLPSLQGGNNWQCSRIFTAVIAIME